MAGAPVGANVGLYMDTRRDVQPGDVIRTGTGRCYLIDTCRTQTRGAHAGRRKHMRVIVIDPADVPDDAVIHPIAWYKRPRR